MALEDHADLGTFFLRIGLGIYFVFSGSALMLNPSMQAAFAGLLSKTPLVALVPALQAVMVIYTCHILVGALLLLGLFTRACGFLIALMSIVTMAVLNWHMTGEFAGSLGLIMLAKDAVLLSAGVSLFFTGARMWAVDCIMVE